MPLFTQNDPREPDIASLLSAWLTEDLAALRRQRDELDARVAQIEQRLLVLSGKPSSAVPALDSGTRDAFLKSEPVVETSTPVLQQPPAESRINSPARDSVRAALGHEALITIQQLDAQIAVLSPVSRVLLNETLDTSISSATITTGFDNADLLEQLRQTVTLLQRALDGHKVSLLQDAALNIANVSELDRETITRYLGLDGEPSETLDMIGAREGVTRERTRQRVARFEARARERRPVALLAREAVEILKSAHKPHTLHEWCSALPSWMSATKPNDLFVLQELERWGWIEPNTWVDIGGMIFVMAGENQQESIRTYHSRYHEANALPYSFGVVKVKDLQTALGLSEAAAEGLLRADPRWSTAHGGWFMRTVATSGWIAKRTVEVLNAVRTVSLVALHQSLKRVATRKFIDPGWAMPHPALLARIVQELLPEGVRFDIVREVLSIDAPIHDADMSGTTQALLKAFGANHRALIGQELVTSIRESGLSDASAIVALSKSPIVTRLERGIYGLVGRHADPRDIANARLRREVARGVGVE